MAQATCIEWLPYSKKNQGRVVIAGFSNGICRWLLLNQDGFFLLKAVKVHLKAITFIKSSPDGQIICIADKDGDIFFIELVKRKLNLCSLFAECDLSNFVSLATEFLQKINYLPFNILYS